MRPLTKVVGKDKFELMFRIRNKEKEGWRRGKIRHEIKQFKHFNKKGYRGQWLEFSGDTQSVKWICYMYKEWDDNHEQKQTG